MKHLIVFDLDGTLAESKSAIDAEMAELLNALLALIRVAIISGGAWPQFENQVLSRLRQDDCLRNLSLLPTCGTRFYQRSAGWQLLYAEDFTAAEKETIIRSLRLAVANTDSAAPKVWGEIIEDRGSQITYSALGQEAPLAAKQKWDPDFARRRSIKVVLDNLIPQFSVRMGGATSVDITRAGIDKGYGIRKLRDILHMPIADMIFIGDALFQGGNDYPAKEAGARSIRVDGPHETKRVIETLLACLQED